MERKNFIKSIGFGLVGSLVGRLALAMNKNKIIKPSMEIAKPLINNRKYIEMRTEQTRAARFDHLS